MDNQWVPITPENVRLGKLGKFVVDRHESVISDVESLLQAMAEVAEAPKLSISMRAMVLGKTKQLQQLQQQQQQQQGQ
ncbi:hypothetical protein FOA52_011985 [Chlamydomonas sp. UWO 241]|nr:hypothetical protein FOA52_011985 [Chlamydomonas sp. UWO 241]